jgi:hydrogenase assembly chaperone HypC/HupF
MCLAAPARVVRVDNDDAIVDLDGVQLKVSRLLVPDIAVGDIALIHVGFILARIDPDEAAASMDALRRVGMEFAP